MTDHPAPVVGSATPADPATRRRRRARRFVPVLAIAVLVALASAACWSSSEAIALTVLMNRDRQNAGVAQVMSDPRLVDKAEAWAATLAREGGLRHSSLWSGMPGECSAVAENVAVAGNPDQIHNLWMNSAPHRANLLSGTYNVTGTGVARGGDGLLYAVTVFGRC